MAMPYSTFDAGGAYEKPAGLVLQPGKRKRINGLALLLQIVIPPAVFSTIFYAVGFDLHYSSPTLAWGLVALGLLATAVTYGLARFRRTFDSEPMWYFFFSFLLGLAVVLGAGVGDYVFRSYMEVSLDFQNLNSYEAIDPAKQKGQQLMDAGRIYFSSGTKLDLSKSMGFQNFDEYCVAPIAKGAGEELASYDYWAVGLNCCSGPDKIFKCGEFNNPHARTGLRYLDEGKRQFFRLAVQQAEAQYGIKALHPLFFTWTQDPLVAVNAQVKVARNLLSLGAITHFFTNLFLVLTALLTFAKMGHYHY
eukprot:TRINITY_DN47377_c0_g1_i1.p1 TRINITY_DN47377_c0_g1~~TRINITY_DN47377_c0_g1_i1.p1  ORF type:complete len:328 (+),score=84.03 TRINITY_DN47377_c0_g1_i1:67-984(+)